MASIVDRYADRIHCVLSCLDRVVIAGGLPEIGHAEAMARFMGSRGIRLFDYARTWEPERDRIREHAGRVAAEAGLEIDYIRRKDFRKEQRIKEIIEQRGDHPGLVHIFSAMERCASFRPWYDKATGRTTLHYRDAKCLHYYFYFIDEELGLCHLRVPTWAPFRVQFYFNGHNLLARQLDRRGIGYRMLDNAFLDIEDFEAAQEIVDRIDVRRLHRRLDQAARRFCPHLRQFRQGYHWSLYQVEYAQDIVFRSGEDLQPVYDAVIRTAVQAVKADDVATFLGRTLPANTSHEVGNDLQMRPQGTRIRHRFGPATIKMYDKHGRILRIETCTNDVTIFKHHRKVEHRDGTSTRKVAPMRKTIYSLPALTRIMDAANTRYLRFISALDDPTTGLKNLEKISEPVRRNDRSWRGFNVFLGPDRLLFQAIARGELAVTGLTNRALRRILPHVKPAAMSRMLRRLRLHGLIKRIRRTYRYHLTRLGQQMLTATLAIRRHCILPKLVS